MEKDTFHFQRGHMVGIDQLIKLTQWFVCLRDGSCKNQPISLDELILIIEMIIPPMFSRLGRQGKIWKMSSMMAGHLFWYDHDGDWNMRHRP